MRLLVLSACGLLCFLPAGSTAAQTGSTSATVLAADSGHVQLSPAGVRTRFVVGSTTTGARGMTLIEAAFPPGHRTTTHLHEIDEEFVYVLAGQLTSTLDGEERTVGPGGVLYVPPETWMALSNRTQKPVRLLVGIARGDAEECFRVLFSRDSSEEAVLEAMADCRVRLR